MAKRLSNGSIQMSDGRIIYADSLITGQDLCEIIPLCVPPPAWPFISGGGGGGGGGSGTPGARGADGAPGAPGAQGPQGTNPGVQGPQGVAGTQGAQGNQGVAGSGAQGAQGNQGFQGSGNESLEQARAIGADFTGGDVFWDDDLGAVFGKLSGQVNQSYERIYYDSGTNEARIDATADGAGTAPALVFRTGNPAVERARFLATGEFLYGATTLFGTEKVRIVGDTRIEGKLTVTGAFDPTSVSLSDPAAGTALFFDSANGETAPISAAGHARIRYNDTTKTWQQSIDGGAYSAITGTDTLAWHNTGDAFGSAKLLGTTDDFDTTIIRNNRTICRTGVEIGPDSQTMDYFRFTRNHDSSQDCIVLENVNAGTSASAIFQFYNDASGAGMVTLCSSTYNTANGSGRGPDVYAMIGHDRLSLCSATDDIAFFLGNTQICEVTAIDANPGSSLKFTRSATGDLYPLHLSNSSSGAASVSMWVNGDVAQGYFGVTSSAYGTTFGLRANTTFVLGTDGGTVTIAANGNNAVFLTSNGVDEMTVGGGAGGIKVGNPSGGIGGYTGGGSMNLEFGVYKNGVAYVNPKWALQHFYTGKADKEGPHAAPKEYRGLMTLEEHEAIVQKRHDLPLMLLNPKGDLFDRGDLVLASVEEAYLYIYQLHRRVKALEARLSAV